MGTMGVDVAPSEEHPGFFAVQLRLDADNPQELAPLEEPVANVGATAGAAVRFCCRSACGACCSAGRGDCCTACSRTRCGDPGAGSALLAPTLAASPLAGSLALHALPAAAASRDPQAAPCVLAPPMQHIADVLRLKLAMDAGEPPLSQLALSRGLEEFEDMLEDLRAETMEAGGQGPVASVVRCAGLVLNRQARRPGSRATCGPPQQPRLA